jgi:hypothetical protein
LKSLLQKIYKWLGFILLLLSISSILLDVYLFDSPYLTFYGLSILGLIISYMGRRLIKLQKEGSVTKLVGKIGFYGNLVIAILFFPLIYFYWGTLIFGP